MEFQEFSGARSRELKLRVNKATIWVVAFIGAVILIAIFASCGGGASSEPSSSQGKAEIACERAIENQVGTKPRAEYTTIDENGIGDFTLYGYVKADYASAKFICNVTGATTKGDASARVNIFN